jgi:hypothetical protein
MIDKLGGILTKGLLGNGPSSMILGHFNLGIFEISIIVTPTSGSGSAVIPNWPSVHPDNYSEEDKFLTIKIKINEIETTKIYRISKNKAKIVIKLNESVKKFIKNTEIFIGNLIPKSVKRVMKINITPK